MHDPYIYISGMRNTTRLILPADVQPTGLLIYSCSVSHKFLIEKLRQINQTSRAVFTYIIHRHPESLEYFERWYFSSVC